VKHCADCGVSFPADLDHFHANGSHKDGLSSYCKACDLERNRRRRKEGEHPRFRWPIVEASPRRPSRVHRNRGGTICNVCPDLIECRTLARYGWPVRCEARDILDVRKRDEKEPWKRLDAQMEAE
jgi:hypothetical protein